MYTKHWSRNEGENQIVLNARRDGSRGWQAEEPHLQGEEERDRAEEEAAEDEGRGDNIRKTSGRLE